MGAGAKMLLGCAALAGVALFGAHASAGLFGSSWEEDRERADACYDKVNDDPELTATDGKLVISYPTVAQLADENVPTEVEAAVVTKGAERVRPCRVLMRDALAKHHPPVVAAFDIRNFQVDLVYVPLIKRRLTYGNANRLLHESFLEFQMRWNQYAQARSDAERRAFAESMNALARQVQSAPPPPPGSGRMTCRWIGPTLYCDPY